MTLQPAKPDGVERVAVIYAAIVILAAALIGGGTQSYLLSDRILQAMVLPLAFYGAVRFGRAPVGLFFGIWISSVILLIAANMGFLLLSALGPWGSSDPHHTLSYAQFLLALIGFLGFAVTLSEQATYHLAIPFMAALLINVTVAAIQLSYSTGSEPEAYFYELTTGFFANANHFSAFVYASIPLLGFALLVHRTQPIIYMAVVLAIGVVVYAANSLAAIGLLAAVASATYYLFSRDRFGKRSRFAGILSLLLVTGGVVGAYVTRTDEIFSKDLRWQFAANTWRAAMDHLPFGSGLGSFHVTYPRYESMDQDLRLYANYAHNDWLETLLETGVPGIALAFAACAVVVVNARKTDLKMAAAIGLFALAVHSLVDYPLRTFMVAIFATFLLSIIWRNSDQKALIM